MNKYFFNIEISLDILIPIRFIRAGFRIQIRSDPVFGLDTDPVSAPGPRLRILAKKRHILLYFFCKALLCPIVYGQTDGQNNQSILPYFVTLITLYVQSISRP